MNTSESIVEITKALIKFQKEVENPKNTAQNPHFKNRYAPLEVVLNEVRPKLANHGLLLLQSPSVEDGNVMISTRIVHESGEWMEFEPLALKIERNTAQGIGAAITYGRRYALSTILGISSEEDDDGNSINHIKKNKIQSNKKPNKQLISKDQAKTLFDLGPVPVVVECLKTLGYESSTDIELDEYDNVVKYIRKTVDRIEREEIREQVEKEQGKIDDKLDPPLTWDEVGELPFEDAKEDA